MNGQIFRQVTRWAIGATALCVALTTVAGFLGLIWAALFLSTFPGGLTEFDFSQISVLAPALGVGSLLLFDAALAVLAGSGIAFTTSAKFVSEDERAAWNALLVRYNVSLAISFAFALGVWALLRRAHFDNPWYWVYFTIVTIIISFVTTRKHQRQIWVRHILGPAIPSAGCCFIVLMLFFTYRSYGPQQIWWEQTLGIMGILLFFGFLWTFVLSGNPNVKLLEAAQIMFPLSVILALAVMSPQYVLGLPLTTLGMGARNVVLVVPPSDQQRMLTFAGICPFGIREVGRSQQYWVSVLLSVGERYLVRCGPKDDLYLTVEQSWAQHFPTVGQYAPPVGGGGFGPALNGNSGSYKDLNRRKGPGGGPP